MFKINFLGILIIGSLLLFKENLIDAITIVVAPLLKLYSRNISIEKAAGTCINLISIYSFLALIFLNMRKQIYAGLTCFLQAYSHPVNLAVFRIVVFSLAFKYFELNQFLLLSQFPSETIVSPIGMGFILKFLPPSPTIIWILSCTFIPTTVLAILGYKIRYTGLVSTAVAAYLIGMPNFYGKVDHFNHQIWFMFILAISPSADVLSIESWQKKNEIRSSHKYSYPLLICWLLLGLMYLFPGIWKLGYSGFEWFLSDNLKYVFIEKYLESGYGPQFSILGYPILYKGMGLFTILFEIAFIFLVFIPRWRLITIASAISFHIGVFFQMGINFLWLILYFGMFIRWDRFIKTDTPSRIEHVQGKKPLLALVGLCSLFGLLGIVNGWPISCYPAFGTIKTNHMTHIEVYHFEERLLLNKVEDIIGSQRIKVLVDPRNKNFIENLKRLRTLIQSNYDINTQDLRFEKVVRDVTHYPENTILEREVINLE